ncbi:glycosyltransferase family 1 protein [Gulosibacter sp. GYB002]|uniref:glycosyltransferase family 4 protein n=1 Tax=Gulosibacter sp. GYB002 TaxID=2994391 RepID=UPI002F96A768
MVTLNFIVDQLTAEVPGGIGRYTENLAREVIRRAPHDCDVAGITSFVSDEQRSALLDRLPGLESVRMSRLNRRMLSQAWRRGVFTNSFGGGLFHSPSLLAPLRPLESGDPAQVVVTIHDIVPWTHPETLTPNGVRWHKAMLKRAWQYAAAVVTPTHAVAEQVAELHDFGDRLRVIPGAASPDIQLPDEAAQHDIAQRFQLPETFILAIGTLEPRKGIDRLIQALAQPRLQDAQLVHVGPEGWGEVDLSSLCAAAGVDRSRVRNLGYVSDAELAVVLDRATVLCMPSLDEGFGLPILEAFKAGTPVVHTDVPALMEVSQGASLHIGLGDEATFVERLSIALSNVLGDSELRETLTLAGQDRQPIYSWAYSADLVWQLHADL